MSTKNPFAIKSIFSIYCSFTVIVRLQDTTQFANKLTRSDKSWTG